MRTSLESTLSGNPISLRAQLCREGQKIKRLKDLEKKNAKLKRMCADMAKNTQFEATAVSLTARCTEFSR